MVKQLVPATSEYWNFIKDLRTHPENIEGFEQQVEITEEQQRRYMQKYSMFYRICLLDNEPVGFVGVIEDDIRIATDPKFKKMGIGKFMIEEIMKEFPTAFAKVKVENTASLKLFSSCGFIPKYTILHKK